MEKHQRIFQRIGFDSRVSLEQSGNLWEAQAADLSLKGLLIEHPDNFEFDQSSPLIAKIWLNEQTPITMTVEWRHSEEGRSGFECCQIDVDSITHLKRLLELNMENREILERELAELGKTS